MSTLVAFLPSICHPVKRILPSAMCRRKDEKPRRATTFLLPFFSMEVNKLDCEEFCCDTRFQDFFTIHFSLLRPVHPFIHSFIHSSIPLTKYFRSRRLRLSALNTLWLEILQKSTIVFVLVAGFTSRVMIKLKLLLFLVSTKRC